MDNAPTSLSRARGAVRTDDEGVTVATPEEERKSALQIATEEETRTSVETAWKKGQQLYIREPRVGKEFKYPCLYLSYSSSYTRTGPLDPAMFEVALTRSALLL